MSKVVFVGNVPYNMSEDTLIDVFKKVGQVVGFRLVFDRETGKPRGYGFCEFADHETAQSAVRNLNNVDCGGRPLRIDLADSDPFLEGKTTMRGELIDNAGGWKERHRDGPPDRDRDPRYSSSGARSSYASGTSGNGSSGDSWLASLPRGTPLPPGVNCMDAISQTVASIRPGQMMEILSSMKTFILEQPERAHALLTAHPQLAYALFQALLVHQIVDPAILHRMIAATSMQNAAAPGPPPPPMDHSPPSHTHHPTPAAPSALPSHLLPHTQSQYPPQHAPPPSSMYQTPPPSVPHMSYHPPPPNPQPSYYQPQPSHPTPPSAASAGHANPSGNDPTSVVPDTQRAMLMQMLQLTNEQINALPPAERHAIQQLRNQFMALGSTMSS
ncbi:hypothetical protein JB92DRAFT_3087925 [Gautieria morchelliformis]|nr:hypothetical protein JB92DRAFT_3087925 [Gautieria morchelliformis]